MDCANWDSQPGVEIDLLNTYIIISVQVPKYIESFYFPVSFCFSYISVPFGVGFHVCMQDI